MQDIPKLEKALLSKLKNIGVPLEYFGSPQALRFFNLPKFEAKTIFDTLQRLIHEKKIRLKPFGSNHDLFMVAKNKNRS